VAAYIPGTISAGVNTLLIQECTSAGASAVTLATLDIPDQAINTPKTYYLKLAPNFARTSHYLRYNFSALVGAGHPGFVQIGLIVGAKQKVA
jgi:hypothetical protein